MTRADRIAKLQRCIELLEEADTLQQQALGASDECYDNHNRIQDIIEAVVEEIG